MTRIQFLTPEQEALIPQYQEKWKRIYLSTQPIERNRAKAAVQGAYAVMGKPEPEVIFCSSPRAALDRLQAYIEMSENNSQALPEEQSNDLFEVLSLVWENIQFTNEKQLITQPLHDLLQDILTDLFKFLEKHIDNCLPANFTLLDIFEQSYIGTFPIGDTLFTKIFEEDFKNQDVENINDLFNQFEEIVSESIKETFDLFASAIDECLGFFSGRGFLFERSLKQAIKKILINKICCLKNYDDNDAITTSLCLLSKKLLEENPPIIIYKYIINCILIDYAISELNYSYNPQKWSALKGLVKHCGCIFTVDNLCIICERPTKILVNEDNQIHAEGETAIEFADGFVAYAYNGTYLPEKYGSIHPTQWQTQWVFEEEYNDLQEVLIQGIGAVRLSEELPLIQEEVEQEVMGEYTLFKLGNKGVKKTNILKRVDSQTGDTHAVFISWMEKTIQRAINYANKNYSAEDFPIPDNGEVE
ncbi:MAG: DUF6745 domain-containing protein [Cyanobacteria bacterium J06643_5]